ncbi:hypothetical protein C2S51_037734 [Perilla frutescens var. frutescens]|nr:hypothetical protein C2S51_037734 [Perilla frutescens var. frutescens]
MEDNSTIPFDQFKLSTNSQIPFDLFVSKKYKGIGIRGFVRFTDFARNLVYTVQKSSYKSATHDQDYVKQLLDSSGNTLFSITGVNVSCFSPIVVLLYCLCILVGSIDVMEF